MAKVATSINAFTSGEWSPRGKGRYDLAKYASGASKLENFLINQLGGVSFRPGTRFIAETKDSSKASRLIPFQYQADSDYVIEAGNLYFKLYENDTDAVVDTQADTYTKLLIHANGNDGATAVRDSGATGRIVTQVATATLSIAQAKFGTSSLKCDGDSDYLTVPASADFLIAGDFTLEGWVYRDNADVGHFGVMGMGDDFNTLGCFRVQVGETGGGQFDCCVVDGVNTLKAVGLGTFPLKTWTHFAVVRSGTDLKGYNNGVLVDYRRIYHSTRQGGYCYKNRFNYLSN